MFANSLFPPLATFTSQPRSLFPAKLAFLPPPPLTPIPGPKCTTSMGLWDDEMLILCSGSLAATQRGHRSAASSEFQGKTATKKV